jgi:hypothetical protein
MLLRILVLWLLVCYSYSNAQCLIDQAGLCTPGVTVTEETQVDITEEDLGTEIVTTTTTTVTTTTTTVTNENSGDILDGTNGYVNSSKEGDMDIDWGGQGPASMPTGNNCYGLGADKCAAITGSGNSTSSMGVDGMGTTFIQTVDISDLNIQKGGQVKYSIEVDKQDAQDRIYMHITGLNGSNQVFAGTDILSESGVATGYQSYNGSFDFAGVLNRLTIEVGGRDINLAVGPVFDDVTVNVFYNVINTIIEQQITTLEQIYYLNIFDPTEIEFVEEVFEYNDISIDDGMVDFAPIEPETEEVTFETVELEIEFEMNFDMEFTPPPPMEILAPTDMQMEMPVNIETVTAEIEMEMQLDIPMPEMDDLPPPEMVASADDMPPPPEMDEVAPPTELETPSEPEVEESAPQIEEVKEEPVVVEETNEEEPTQEESEPDSETTEEPAVEPEDSGEQEEVQQEETEEPEKPVKEPSAKEKAATKIVKKIDDKARYDESNQMKTLIVMQILGNTKTFFDAQSTIQDTNVNEYLNKTLEDNYGVLFDMAQGQTMEEMINDQY